MFAEWLFIPFSEICDKFHISKASLTLKSKWFLYVQTPGAHRLYSRRYVEELHQWLDTQWPSPEALRQFARDSETRALIKQIKLRLVENVEHVAKRCNDSLGPPEISEILEIARSSADRWFNNGSLPQTRGHLLCSAKDVKKLIKWHTPWQ
jgi:hypothetical protein